jgi:hypothetical protein
MFTHHLTFVQSKYLFVTKQCVAYRATHALSLADIRLYELRPIIVATLAVDEQPIYWQSLFFADEPLPLASFLYWAWMELLGGMPECLLVQSEMVELVRRALTQLDPEKVIHMLEPGHGHGFTSTKRQAQFFCDHCIEIDFEKENPSPTPATQHETLARLNERLTTYHRHRQSTLKAISPTGAADPDEHLHSELHRPAWPMKVLTVDFSHWLKRPLPGQHLSEPAGDLRIEADCGWCAVVSSFHCNIQKPAFSPFDQALYLVHELQWFKSTVRSLPFPLAKLFGSIIEPDDLESFLSFRKQVSGAVAAQLYRVLLTERPGLVLFPHTELEFKDVVNMLGYGGGERLCAELVGGQMPFPYRVFALDENYRLNLLVVQKGSQADCKSLNQEHHQNIVKIEVGAPAFAAIVYWLKNLLPGVEWEHSPALLDMVQSMLWTIPEWVQANRPKEAGPDHATERSPRTRRVKVKVKVKDDWLQRLRAMDEASNLDNSGQLGDVSLETSERTSKAQIKKVGNQSRPHGAHSGISFESPNARAVWVYATHQCGSTVKEIAGTLGLSVSRVAQLSQKGRRITDGAFTLWYSGLDVRIAYHLIDQGYSSREQVYQAVLNSNITDQPSPEQRAKIPYVGQTTVPNLGKIGFRTLLEWLGIEHEH